MKKNKGFSLIEIIISIALIMVMIFVYLSFLNLIKLNKQNSDNSIANFILNQELETVKNMKYSDISLMQDAPFVGSINLSLLNGASGKLTVVKMYNDDNLKLVTATLSWLSKSTTKSLTQSIVISSYGLSQK